MKLFILVFLLFAINYSVCHNILLFFPLPVKSLSILAEGYIRHLLQDGHNITYVTTFPKKRNEKNLRQIDVSFNRILTEDEKMINISQIISGSSQMNSIKDLQEFALIVANRTFENRNVRNLLQNKNEQFDLVIIDLYEIEVYSGLAVLYDCPFIWANSMGANWNTLYLVDEATNPAYTTDYRSFNTYPLSFLERLEELWIQIKSSAVKRLSTMPKEEMMYRTVFKPLLDERGKPLPRYEDVVYNASLMFSNENICFGNVPSTPQNFKIITGQHIDTPKPLPEDLQTLMDSAKYGVIYFSLGSKWKSKHIPETMTNNLLKIFGGLKQTVIWKYEAILKNLPKNVHILNWAPQHSILAHPNCILFITHGGLLSSTEALHFGVPIIGIPIFVDQFVNINRAVASGYALKADLNLNLAQNLKDALEIMLSTDRFKQKVKELSALYHDRLVPPGQELAYWVNYVIRNRGAPHLRSPALHTPFYHKMFLDLIAVILIVEISVVYAFQLISVKKKPKAVWAKKNN